MKKENGIYVPSWHSVCEVVLHFDDESRTTIPADQYSNGALHATMGGQCVVVPAEVFWPWVCELVGVTIVGEYISNQSVGFLDFDQVEKSNADRVIGLHAYRTVGESQKIVQEVSLSVGEFWDALNARASSV